jgi:hypothetical protein
MGNGSESVCGISRREFISSAAVGFVAITLAATGLGVVADAFEKASIVDEFSALALLRGLSAAAFAAHLGEKFLVRQEAVTLGELQLTRVTDLEARLSSPAKADVAVQRLDCFSVTFSGPGLRSLKQGTYRFAHRELGEFPLFIVPVGPPTDKTYYEAIFNRLAA